MPNTIYYFSGTGNSLATAKSLAQQIGDCKIVNIAASTSIEEMTDQSHMVGFVFPVHFENIPDIVKNFVEKMEFEPNSYVFGVATCGSEPASALHTLDKVLKKKGVKLAAGFGIEMPDNVVIVFDMIPSLDVQKSMLSNSKKKIKQIVDIVKTRQVAGLEGKRRFRDRLEGLFMKLIVTRIYRTPKRFRVTDKCVKCGSCISICPTGNIEVNNGRIEWGKDCTHCLGCLHWCPTQAIKLGRGSIQRRYHHPDITIKNMILR